MATIKQLCLPELFFIFVKNQLFYCCKAIKLTQFANCYNMAIILYKAVMESKYQLAITWDGDKTTTLFKEVLVSDLPMVKNVLKAAQDIKIEREVLAQHNERMKGAPALIINQAPSPVIETLSSVAAKNPQDDLPGDYYRRTMITKKTWRDYKAYIACGVLMLGSLIMVQSIPKKVPANESAPTVEESIKKPVEKKKQQQKKKKNIERNKKQPTEKKQPGKDTYNIDDVFNNSGDKNVSGKRTDTVNNNTDKANNNTLDSVDSYKMMDQLKILNK